MRPREDRAFEGLVAASRARAREQHVDQQLYFHDWIVAGRAYKRISLPQRIHTGHTS